MSVTNKTPCENNIINTCIPNNQSNIKPVDNTLPTITNTINNSTTEKLDYSDDSTEKKDNLNLNEELELHSLGNSGDVEDIDLVITKLKYNKKYKRSHKRSNYSNSNNSNTVNLLNDNSVSTVDLKRKPETEKTLDDREQPDQNAFVNFVYSKKKSLSNLLKDENKIKSLLVKNNFEEQI